MLSYDGNRGFLFNLNLSTYENYVKKAIDALYRLYEEEFIINPN